MKGFIPLFDRVLVERFAAEVKTKGGIMIPVKSQGKVLQATVLSVGPGKRQEVRKSAASDCIVSGAGKTIYKVGSKQVLPCRNIFQKGLGMTVMGVW